MIKEYLCHSFTVIKLGSEISSHTARTQSIKATISYPMQIGKIIFTYTKRRSFMKHMSALKRRKYAYINKQITQMGLALLVTLFFSFPTTHAQEVIRIT